MHAFFILPKNNVAIGIKLWKQSTIKWKIRMEKGSEEEEEINK